MQVSSSYVKKINAAVDRKITAAINQLQGMSACAGIRGGTTASVDLAKKARINHYGSFSRNIPSRKWVDVWDRKNQYGLPGEIRGEIMEALREELSSDTGVRAKLAPGTDYRIEAEPTLFARKSVGPKRFMEDLARILKEYQVEAIENRDFGPNTAGVGDPQHNAPSVEKSKKKDKPLEWKINLADKIESWVE